MADYRVLKPQYGDLVGNRASTLLRFGDSVANEVLEFPISWGFTPARQHPNIQISNKVLSSLDQILQVNPSAADLSKNRNPMTISIVAPATGTMPEAGLALTFLVNPASLSMNRSQDNTVVQSRIGPSVILDGVQSPLEMSVSGKTPAFITVDKGLVSGRGFGSRRDSLGYLNLMSLSLLFRSNGANRLTYEKMFGRSLSEVLDRHSAARNAGQGSVGAAISVMDNVALSYDGAVRYGFFTSFQMTESADTPFLLDYTFQFMAMGDLGTRYSGHLGVHPESGLRDNRDTPVIITTRDSKEVEQVSMGALQEGGVAGEIPNWALGYDLNSFEIDPPERPAPVEYRPSQGNAAAIPMEAAVNLIALARKHGLDPSGLFYTIQSESSWNPAIENKSTGGMVARGLIQFTNTSNRAFFEQVNGMSAADQLKLGGPVDRYFARQNDPPGGDFTLIKMKVMMPHAADHYASRLGSGDERFVSPGKNVGLRYLITAWYQNWGYDNGDPQAPGAPYWLWVKAPSPVGGKRLFDRNDLQGLPSLEGVPRAIYADKEKKIKVPNNIHDWSEKKGPSGMTPLEVVGGLYINYGQVQKLLTAQQVINSSGMDVYNYLLNNGVRFL